MTEEYVEPETCEQCGVEIGDFIEPEWNEGYGPFCGGDCASDYMKENFDEDEEE